MWGEDNVAVRTRLLKDRLESGALDISKDSEVPAFVVEYERHFVVSGGQRALSLSQLRLVLDGDRSEVRHVAVYAYVAVPALRIAWLGCLVYID
jgi:hypothetical protein